VIYHRIIREFRQDNVILQNIRLQKEVPCVDYLHFSLDLFWFRLQLTSLLSPPVI
jgi:hypothetical protein